MSKQNYFSIISLSMLFFLLSMSMQSQISVYNLTCEQDVNPLSVETEHPHFSWQINSDRRGFVQEAFQVLVSDSKRELENNIGNCWDSGKKVSDTSILVAYDGKPLESGVQYFWKVRIWDKDGTSSTWSKASTFAMGLLNEKDWDGAQWISLQQDDKKYIIVPGMHRWPEKAITDRLGNKSLCEYVMPQFRKDFSVNKKIHRATAYVSGMGQFEFFLNGKKVSNHFLDPGWTKYDKCALYVTFDIAKQLRQGANTIGVMLGNGFFNIPTERYYKLITSYGAPRMIAKITIEYEDGTTENIVSSKDWKASASPITFSSIYGGEDYDATKEQPGWMLPGFNDKKWSKVITSKRDVRLVAQNSEPLTIRDRIAPINIFKNQKGRYVYDLGQNFSGIINVTIKSEKSKYIKMFPAELLKSDSTINQRASGEECWFGFTPKTDENENWQPQFTYYGFRYVEIEGAVPAGKPNPDNLPVITNLVGLHTTLNAPESGTFSCSNQLFNQVIKLTDWAARSNMASVLTDCPHREKLGWLEQTHLMQSSLQYLYNLSRLYGKITQDMQTSQTEEGMIPDIAPEYVEFEDGFRDTPNWGSTFILSPWYIWQWYGDMRPIEKYYPDMQRYVDYLTSKSENHIISYGLGDWLDISKDKPTSVGVMSTSVYYLDVVTLGKMARLLKKDADATRYDQLAETIKKSFNDKFWNPQTKIYDKGSQATNSIVLYTGLCLEKNRAKVLSDLIADIRQRNNAITAGEVSYVYVLRTLAENGASDIIYDMNNKYDVPGYGWMLNHGATSLTEAWDSNPNLSQNHFCFGHLTEWLFSNIGGIRLKEDAVGFKEFLIKPEIIRDIREAAASYVSPYGKIRSEWKISGSNWIENIEVPCNSSAYFYLPTIDASSVTESGVNLSDVNGISIIGQENGRLLVKLGSGSYHFCINNWKEEQ